MPRRRWRCSTALARRATSSACPRASWPTPRPDPARPAPSPGSPRVLPAAADDRSLVQVRVLTANAAGQDEWVGVDDLAVTAGGAGCLCPGGCGCAPPSAPTPPGAGPGAPALAISDLALEPPVFAPARKGPATLRRGRSGTGLRYRLSAIATVRFEVRRVSEPAAHGAAVRPASTMAASPSTAAAASTACASPGGCADDRWRGAPTGWRPRCPPRAARVDGGRDASGSGGERSPGGRSERAHVGAARGERHAAHVAVGGLAAQALHQRAGLLPVAPEQHGRARRRRSSPPPRPAPRRAPPAPSSAGRARAGAAGAAGRAARGRSGRSRRCARPSTSSEACPTLCTASASGTSAGIAARACAVGTCSGGIASTPSRPAGGSKRTGSSAPVQITKPPSSAAATLSGWPSSSTASSNSGASSSYMWSAAARPATIAAALEPSPAAAGISERI